MTDSFHSFTRKEIASWVESHTRYKFQELKNGVFFCKMLALRFPEDAAMLKYNPTPVSEYDCTTNLNLMKKVLNKRGLQLNINVQTVLTSKNNFELAKWFRGLCEPIEAVVDNYSSVQRDSVSTYRDTSRKMQDETPKKCQEKEKEKKKIESAEKLSKISLSKVKRLSMAKSQAGFFKQKLGMRTQLKIPTYRRERKEEGFHQRAYETQMMMPKSSQINEGDDINEVLYERALQQSIQSLTKMVNRIKGALNTQAESVSQYKKALSKAIFMR